MATAREDNPYESSGSGRGEAGFGKFRKRPFRKPQTTPYDRPPTAVRNPNRNNGWLSKIVDPAQRFIAYSANKLLSSVFRKRLPPPSPTPLSSEAVQEGRDNHQEAAVFEQVANDLSCKQQVAVVESDVQVNMSDGGELTDLEKLLKQKTFTSEEINHLTTLMHSRTLDSAVRGEGKRTEMVLPSDPLLHSNLKNDNSKTPEPENGIQTPEPEPYVTTNAPIEENVASSAELAKTYMGSRPSKVSPSMLGLHSLPRGDQTLLKSQHFTSEPIMSVVRRATTSLARVHDNGFLTPRSHGRSAIHSMNQTPYGRVCPASSQGVGVALGQSSSSAQYALDHNMRSGFKQGALKHRSSVLDSDIGFVGPIRRIRHKSNRLSSKSLALPHSGSPLYISRSRVDTVAAQQLSYFTQKPIFLGEVKQSYQKLSAENIHDRKPTAIFPPLPSRSSEMVSKISQQLDMLVSPKEKSFELRLPILNDKSPMKLSSSMLRGQALRSMETVDSSKFLDNIRENKLDGMIGNSSATAEKLSSRIDKVKNGSLKFVAPIDGKVCVITDTDATVPRKQVISIAKLEDSSLTKPISYPQKMRGFHISAHEDYLEMDEDAYPNGAVSSFPLSGKEATSATAVVDKTTSSTATIVQKPLGSSIVMPSNNFAVDGKPHVGTVDGEKVDVLTSRTSCISDLTFKTVRAAATAATQAIVGSDKSASPNGSLANPPPFNFGNKVVPSMEPTAANSPSKESTSSGPVFGLENVVSSKEAGADDLVNLGINKNIQNAPQVPFTSLSSVGGEFNGVKFGGASDSNKENSVSSTTVTGVTDSIPKALQSDDADAKANTITGFSTRASEPAVSSAVSTPLSTSPMNVFTFGDSSNQHGLVALSPSFSSSLPSMVTNNFTSLNMFSSSPLAASSSSYIGDTAASTSISLTTSTPAVIASSNISSNIPEVASPSSTPSVFKFGSTPSPSTGLPVSSTSGSEPVETKKDTGIGILSSTSHGSSSTAVGSTMSGIFGFSSSAMPAVNSQSQVSADGTTSSPVSGAMAPPATSGFASSTKSQSMAFGSSASSSFFGLTGNTAFSSGSSSFASSNPATNIFNSGTTFGQSTIAFSSEANSVSSNSATSSTPFGLSSWQSASFGSSFNSSSSSSPGFSFGAASVASTSSPMMFGSTTSASSAPQFSFTSAAPTTNMQPAFGSSSPVFAFGSAPVNNDQMGTADSMAEDTVQTTPLVTPPVFGQQPALPQSSFVFGAPTPTGANPFQFSSQQNCASPNPSPFQASGSLEFNSGGSFSLGPGGSDKSGRKIIRVNKNKLRKK